MMKLCPSCRTLVKSRDPRCPECEGLMATTRGAGRAALGLAVGLAFSGCGPLGDSGDTDTPSPSEVPNWTGTAVVTPSPTPSPAPTPTSTLPGTEPGTAAPTEEPATTGTAAVTPTA